MSRPAPLEAVFGPLADERFPALRDALAAGGHDPADRDAFVLVGPVVEFLRALRPEEGVGEGAGELVAFVHAAFLCWAAGAPLLEVGSDALDVLVREPAGPPAGPARAAYYVQLAPRRVWGEPLPGAAPEPLDGWFAVARPEGLDVVAVFGMHPGRAGLTAALVRGSRPVGLRRPDGTALFAPRMEGGAAAGLRSLAGAEELLELAHRAHARLGGEAPRPGRQPLPAAV